MQTKQAILVVSYGSSKKSALENAIGGIERAIQTAFPNLLFYHALTSSYCINQLREQDNYMIPTVTEAMDQIVLDGITTLIVVPTHLLPGFSYTTLIDSLIPYQSTFQSLLIGKPLLEAQDWDLISALQPNFKNFDSDSDTAFLYMGHGTTHMANECYSKLEHQFHLLGCSNCYVITIDTITTMKPLLDTLASHSYKKVYLHPLLLLAGHHTHTDMASEKETSLYSLLTEAGYQVTCVIKGLGEYPSIQQLFVKRIRTLLQSLS